MNNKIALLFGTSLYDLKQPQMPPAADLMLRDGLRLFTPAAAIIRAPEGFFASNPIETQVVLASFRDASDLLRRLLDGGHTVVAGRLAGALRHIGRGDAAGRDRHDHESRGLRRAREQSVRGPRAGGGGRGGGGADRRTDAGDVGSRCAGKFSKSSRRRRACPKTGQRSCNSSTISTAPMLTTPCPSKASACPRLSSNA